MHRKSGSKGSPNGPQKLTKIDKKRVQEGSQKETSKTTPKKAQHEPVLASEREAR